MNQGPHAFKVLSLCRIPSPLILVVKRTQGKMTKLDGQDPRRPNESLNCTIMTNKFKTSENTLLKNTNPNPKERV